MECSRTGDVTECNDTVAHQEHGQHWVLTTGMHYVVDDTYAN